MLLHALHQLSNLAILAFVVVTVTGIAMLAPHIGRHVFRLPASDARDEAAFDAFKAVLSMTGVVLAFSLVQANSNLHGIEATVGREAAAINATDRVLLRMGRPDVVALRPLLAGYGKAVVDEWPLLSNNDRSDDADAVYGQLSRAVRALAPDDARQQTQFAELLKDVDDLADIREEIILDSDIGLPGFFWITTGGLLLLALGLAILTKNSLGRTVGVGATAAAVALLLAFVIIVDLPFEGETSVSAAPIMKALELDSHRN